MKRSKLALVCTAALAGGSIVVLACQNDSPRLPTEATQPQLAFAEDGQDVQGDTYLDQTDKNANNSHFDELNHRTSSKNASLIQPKDGAITAAGDHIRQTGDRVFLVLTIKDNNSDCGIEGCPIDIRRMVHSWTAASATWNCSVDGDLGNNQADCEGSDAWNVNAGLDGDGNPLYSPAAGQPAETELITNDMVRGDQVRFDVTDDILAFTDPASPAAPYGWIVQRTSPDLAGDFSFWSSENADGPELVSEACPVGTICGATTVQLAQVNGQTTNGEPFQVLVGVEGVCDAETGQNCIARLEVPAANVQIAGNPADLSTLIFTVQQLPNATTKCLGLANPGLEIGPCYEAFAFEPETEQRYGITFREAVPFGACVAAAATTMAEGVGARWVRRATFPGNIHSPDEDPLTVIQPSATSLDLDCGAIAFGQLEPSNGLLRLAGNVWRKVKERVSPPDLYAATSAVRCCDGGTTGDLPGLSFYSVALVEVSYRSIDNTWASVGKKCDACDLNRVPRNWYEPGFSDFTGWNVDGAGAFGSSTDETTCDLYESVLGDWPQADPKFNPPEKTDILVRNSFVIDDPAEHIGLSGTVTLQVRIAGRNAFRAYLNGTEITEYVTTHPVPKRNQGITIEGGDFCPEYDEIIISVPQSAGLLNFQSHDGPPNPNLIAIHGESTVDEPSFLDYQVNVLADLSGGS